MSKLINQQAITKLAQGLHDKAKQAVANESARAIEVEESLDARISTIEGQGEGSISKALKDAKSYTDSVLSGKSDIGHTHSADDVAETDDKQFVSATKKAQYDENTIFTTDMLTVNALGGIKAGENLNDMPIQTLLTKLLYPYVAPVVSVQGTPNGGTYEKGDTKQITNVKVTVTKKSERITSIVVKDGVSTIGTKSGSEVENGGTFNFTVAVDVPSVNKTLSVEVTDASNQTYRYSTGTFNFVYPYYMGVCSENADINEVLVEGLTKKVEAKGNKSHSFTCDYQRMIFAYPKSYGALKSIIDPNNFDVTGTFGRQELSITGLDGTAQTYYVYVNSASTVANFNMKFNY